MRQKMTYFDVARHIKPADLPADIAELFTFVRDATEGHTTWDYYEADTEIKAAADTAMKRVLDFLEDQGRETPEKPADAPKPKKAGKPKPPKPAAPRPETPKPEKPGTKPPVPAPKLVPSIDAGLALVKRIHNMVGRERTLGQMVNLLAAIQKAQEKGQLSKTGDGAAAYAQLKKYEARFVNALNTTLSDKPLDFPITLTIEKQEDLLALEAVALGAKQNPLVALILRFLGMQGKPVEVAKAARLLAAIKRETESGRVGNGSPQFTAIKGAMKSLEDYIAGKRKTPKVSSETLNGLQGILAACQCKKCKPLDGIPTDAKAFTTAYTPTVSPLPGAESIAPSKQDYFAPAAQSAITPTRPASQASYIIAPPIQQGKPNPITYASHRPLTNHVPTYPFTGRWKELFNEPSKGFTALVYGQPKSGKSTMAIDFAGYLARNFGRVLYASIEEGGRGTLDERISRLGVGHPNMDISNNLPADLNRYDFIITDSVSRGNLDLSQMQQLKADWPDKSFIFLFHTTKDGLPRGTNQFLHEVDVLVNVKQGVATADGRFGPGSMDVRFS